MTQEQSKAVELATSQSAYAAAYDATSQSAAAARESLYAAATTTALNPIPVAD